MDRFGSDGYLVFFGILEMISREFDIKNPGIVTLSRNFCRRKLRLSWHKCSTILKFCEEEGRFFVSDNGRKITINCPKSKEMLDDWTKRQLRSLSGVTSEKLPLDRDRDREKEKERRDFTSGSGKEKKEYVSKWSDFICKECGGKTDHLSDSLCPECLEKRQDEIFEDMRRRRESGEV